MCCEERRINPVFLIKTRVFMKTDFFLLIVFTAFVVFNVVVFLFFRFFVKDEPAISKNDRRKNREAKSVSDAQTDDGGVSVSA